MKIAVKYCGNCNPEIDTTRIVQMLREKFNGKGVEFVQDLGFLPFVPLLLCGCRKGCLDRDEITGALMQRIVVKGKTVEVHRPPGLLDGPEELFSLLLGEIMNWMDDQCFS